MSTEQPAVVVRPAVTFAVASDEELDRPFRVIIQNDDVTPMEFVVLVLRLFFDLTGARAEQVMLTAHNEGRALVAVLPYQAAQERVYGAHHVAREAGYPLTFYLEPDES